MSVHKARMPGSIEDAVTRIAGELTPEVAAAAVGRSSVLIRKWGDPDCDAQPNLRQAMALDAAYVSATAEAPPILTVYTELLRQAVEGFPDAGVDLVGQLMGMAEDLGGFSATLNEVHGMPSKRVVSRSVAIRMLESLAHLEGHVATCRGVITQTLESAHGE